MQEMDFLDHFFSEEDDDFFKDSSSDSEESSASSSEEDGPPRKKLVHIENFIENTVFRYSLDEFQSHFRLSRNTMNFLIGVVGNAHILALQSFGREKISPEKACLAEVWYLANKETFRQISDRFDVSQSAAHAVINKIVHFFVTLSPQYIKWPNEREAVQISEEFSRKQNIRGVLGAIDGSHITIPKPKVNQEAYCNRKGYHSILLQGVCDSKKRFIDVFCGEAGSVHDARLLRRSSLYEKAQNGEMFFGGKYFLLGDSAYPSLPWLVPPFRDTGTLTANQRIFNYKHSSTRIVIENSFGLLKGRFRRLFGFDNINIPFVVNCVVATCVLHNICINMDDLNIDRTAENDVQDNIDLDNFDEIELVNDKRNEIFVDMFP